MKTKLKNRISLIVVCASFLVLASSCKKEAEDDPSVIKDGDGNVYASVTIGTQVWLKENLKTTKYNDGTSIPLVTDVTWRDLTTPGYCWYDNDEATYKNTYGALYNWYVVNTGKLCPKGWHVPSDTEWTTLATNLGGEDIAGGKLKEAGTTHWNPPNTLGFNESGFTALPGGLRSFGGSFGYIGQINFLWSSDQSGGPTAAWDRRLNYDDGKISRYGEYKTQGHSVRCIKD